jgi:HEAT repeat protein
LTVHIFPQLIPVGVTAEGTEGVVKRLIGELRDAHPSVRWRAAIDFGRLGKTAPAAVPGLIECLRGPDEDVRKLAALVLSVIGSDARPAAVALVDALEDDDALIRQRAAVALGHTGHGAVLPALRNALTDRNEAVRKVAALAIVELQAVRLSGAA